MQELKDPIVMSMEDKPLISLIVVAYKQEAFVREAVRSAFAQTYEPLEIILSDDCSPDRTYEIMRQEAAAYNGQHTIVLNQNERNLGLAAHMNRVWELTRGELVVAHSGDDVSVPHRVSVLVRRWQSTETPVDLVCSYFSEVDVDGRPTGFVEKNVVFVPDISQDVLDWTCGATGACAAYTRKLYEKYGPLDTRVLAEDWVFPFRAWIESSIAVVEEPLVNHRTHDDSISVAHGRRGIRREHSAALRRSRRRRNAENQLAIATEWLRAWEIGGDKEIVQIPIELRRLIRVRELQLRVFDCTRIQALRVAFSVYKERGGLLMAARLLIRRVLNWY